MRIQRDRGCVVVLSALAVVLGSMPASGADALSPTAAATRADQLLTLEIGANPAASVPLSGDEVFARRVYFDLVGQPPTAFELSTFVLDPTPHKRELLVERLLDDERFGTNWGRYWRDVILYRRSEDRALITSRSLEEFLTKELNQGTGWHEIAHKFVTATGDVLEEGSTALIMAQMGDTEAVAAEVSRIFMGIQIQCAQCHDHPTDRWKRTQFHELAAFFPRIAVRRKPNATPRSFEVVSVNFAGRRRPGMNGTTTTEHYMTDLEDATSRGTLMQPKFFVTSRSLPTGTGDLARRTLFANWLTNDSNPWFGRAFVNRVWAELVGEGFYEPVDDMGPDRECSAPNTLEHLASEFRLHDHDVKWLYQTIVATRAYQQESRARRSFDQLPFAANCSQRLRGDQLYDALRAALDMPESGFSFAGRRPSGQGGYGFQRGVRQQFVQAFGFDPSTPRDEVAGSIPQALLLMNSPLVQTYIRGDRPNTMLGRLLADTKNDETVCAELYLRCLAREPKAKELQTCLEHLRDTGDRAQAFEDVLWALVNSSEFLHRQ